MLGVENTTFEIQEDAGNLAILGIGSCEQHSHHLPIETDFFFAEKISLEVAEELSACYLNPLPYSTSLEMRGFAGTVTLQPETLQRVVTDIARSTSEWEIRYLALINAHGGNFILNPTARAWNMDGLLPRILLIDYYLGLTGTHPNLHAGDVETSMMLHLAPEKVRLDRRQDFVPEWSRPDLTHLGMKKICPEGVWGLPSRATAEKGETWFREGIDYCVERIETLMAHF